MLEEDFEDDILICRLFLGMSKDQFASVLRGGPWRPRYLCDELPRSSRFRDPGRNRIEIPYCFQYNVANYRFVDQQSGNLTELL